MPEDSSQPSLIAVSLYDSPFSLEPPKSLHLPGSSRALIHSLDNKNRHSDLYKKKYASKESLDKSITNYNDNYYNFINIINIFDDIYYISF